VQRALLNLALGRLERDALKAAAGLALSVVLALAFALASFVAVLFSAVPGPRVETVAGAVKHGPLAPGGANARALELARAQTGMPYVWGGASPESSFDCSGLVQWAFGQAGVRLPRTAQQQHDATARVPVEALQPGDLLFFAHTYAGSHEPITHVGIYVGDGRMLNAPVEGDVVREMPAFTGFWGRHFAGAGRVASGPGGR
jgi:cell wall-associated NlpC family hydrolase